MNKTELIMAVAEKANISKKDADTAVNAVIDTIVETLAKDEKVQLVGFGTFEVRSRSERQGRDPRTNSLLSLFLLLKFLPLRLAKPLRVLSTNKKPSLGKLWNGNPELFCYLQTGGMNRFFIA